MSKGKRNNNHNLKRVVSSRKFERILNKNIGNLGVASIYRPREGSILKSSRAVQVGNYIYAEFKVRNKDEVFHIRYDSANPVDFVNFGEYPNHLVVNVLDI